MELLLSQLIDPKNEVEYISLHLCTSLINSTPRTIKGHVCVCICVCVFVWGRKWVSERVRKGERDRHRIFWPQSTKSDHMVREAHIENILRFNFLYFIPSSHVTQWEKMSGHTCLCFIQVGSARVVQRDSEYYTLWGVSDLFNIKPPSSLLSRVPLYYLKLNV